MTGCPGNTRIIKGLHHNLVIGAHQPEGSADTAYHLSMNLLEDGEKTH